MFSVSALFSRKENVPPASENPQRDLSKDFGGDYTMDKNSFGTPRPNANASDESLMRQLVKCNLKQADTQAKAVEILGEAQADRNAKHNESQQDRRDRHNASQQDRRDKHNASQQDRDDKHDALRQDLTEAKEDLKETIIRAGKEQAEDLIRVFTNIMSPPPCTSSLRQPGVATPCSVFSTKHSQA